MGAKTLASMLTPLRKFVVNLTILFTYEDYQQEDQIVLLWQRETSLWYLQLYSMTFIYGCHKGQLLKMLSTTSYCPWQLYLFLLEIRYTSNSEVSLLQQNECESYMHASTCKADFKHSILKVWWALIGNKL